MRSQRAKARKRYGAKYSRMLDETDYEYGTIANALYVSRKLEFSRRHENLSWSHHKEVAALLPDEQAWNTQESIAARFGMPQTTVSDIINKFTENSEFAKTVNAFEPYLYNIWNNIMLRELLR